MLTLQNLICFMLSVFSAPSLGLPPSCRRHTNKAKLFAPLGGRLMLQHAAETPLALRWEKACIEVVFSCSKTGELGVLFRHNSDSLMRPEAIE